MDQRAELQGDLPEQASAPDGLGSLLSEKASGVCVTDTEQGNGIE